LLFARMYDIQNPEAAISRSAEGLALGRYFSILRNESKARYLTCETLDDKVEKAEQILKNCHLCERRCSVDRSRGEKGFCRVTEPKISSEFLHHGEEPELVPSHTFFFSGCTFACVFCQNWDISQSPDAGACVKPETIVKSIENTVSRNVNWVGGDPTPNIHFILSVLAKSSKNTPQIFNSNMYVSEESMELLNGVMDVFLTDFKYGNDECANRYSDAQDYWGITTRNHLLAKDQTEVIIRHLVMPFHLECCTLPIMDWISEYIPNARVNLMDQYHPEYRAWDYDELSLRVSRNEYSVARDYALELDLILS